MRNRKIRIGLLIVCVMLLQSVCTAAAKPTKGSIRIILTDGEAGTSKENVVFEYGKVADILDGKYVLRTGYEEYEGPDLNEVKTAIEAEEAAWMLSRTAEAKDRVSTNKNGEAVIRDLEPGVYILRTADADAYEVVTPILAAIPAWNEEKGCMETDITVVPKHSPRAKPVQTGDDSPYLVYAATALGSASALIAADFRKRHRKKEK